MIRFLPKLLCLLLLAGGCSSMKRGTYETVSPVSDRERVGNVYLLRGFVGIFSTGIDRLGVELNDAGIYAMVYQDDQWSSLADTIARQFHGRQNDAEPLVLIGHSYGADDVIRMCRKLQDAGVPVDLLITLDPTTPPEVPKNVKLCVNLYQSNGGWDKIPMFRGIALKQEAGSTGTLVNANIRTDRQDLLEPNLDHFNIEKKVKVHEEVLKTVMEQCLPRQQWLAMKNKPATLPSELAGPARAVENPVATGVGDGMQAHTLSEQAGQ